MVEVFKTNVKKKRDAKMLLSILSECFPNHQINFDLGDCDHILRIEGNTLLPETVVALVTANNYECVVLE